MKKSETKKKKKIVGLIIKENKIKLIYWQQTLTKFARKFSLVNSQT